MTKFLIFVGFFAISCFLNAQENDLNSFIENQNAKLVYDQSKLVVAPNTNVKLIPPEYFELEPNINGFVHKGSAATIQIIEVSGISYRDVVAGMTYDYIESQNYKYIDKINLQTHNGNDAVIFFVQFSSGEMIYERAMLFTGEENTIWVNFNYPLSMKKLLYPAIEACLISVE